MLVLVPVSLSSRDKDRKVSYRFASCSRSTTNPGTSFRNRNPSAEPGPSFRIKGAIPSDPLPSRYLSLLRERTSGECIPAFELETAY